MNGISEWTLQEVLPVSLTFMAIISRKSSNVCDLTPLLEFNTIHIHFNVVKEKVNALKFRCST